MNSKSVYVNYEEPSKKAHLVLGFVTLLYTKIICNFFFILAIGCVNPLQPNLEQTHVRMLDFAWDYVYNFTDNVTYVCDTPQDHFTHDFDLQNFTLTCQEDGNWTAYPNLICEHEDSKIKFLRIY